jgi:hypothetical protein
MQPIVVAPIDTSALAQMLDVLASPDKYKKKLAEFKLAQDSALAAKEDAEKRLADAKEAERNAASAQERTKAAILELAGKASALAKAQEDHLGMASAFGEKQERELKALEEAKARLTQHEYRLEARETVLDADVKDHENRVRDWQHTQVQQEMALKSEKEIFKRDRGALDGRIALARKLVEEAK